MAQDADEGGAGDGCDDAAHGDRTEHGGRGTRGDGRSSGIAIMAMKTAGRPASQPSAFAVITAAGLLDVASEDEPLGDADAVEQHRRKHDGGGDDHGWMIFGETPEGAWRHADRPGERGGAGGGERPVAAADAFDLAREDAGLRVAQRGSFERAQRRRGWGSMAASGTPAL